MFNKSKIILPPAERIRKILIIGHSNIGDIATDTLFLKPLARQYPRARIYFSTSPRAREMASCYRGVHQIIVLDKKGAHRGFLGRVRFHQEMAREQFDLVIVLVKTFMHFFLRPAYCWDIRRMYAADYKNKSVHPVDVYLKFIHSSGLPLDQDWFDFNFESESVFCEGFLARHGINPGDSLVGILPLAAWGLKNWPIKKWNALAKRLKEERGLKTIAFGKTSGDFVGQEVLDNISPDIISAIDQLTLKQSLFLISQCKFFIGPDSSLLHIASNLRVETIGLYGPTPPDYVYPYFHRENLIVARNIPTQYICSKDPYSCACREEKLPSPCMDSISVENVFEAVVSQM